jgi:nicotinamidase-related amidase
MEIDTSKIPTALIICDLQADLLGSVKNKKHFLQALSIVIEAARNNDWLLAYSGLQFESSYKGISHRHKLYGALAKLNSKLGDQAVHWFMKNWPGSDILSSDPKLTPCLRKGDKIIWRSRHIPYELVNILKKESIAKVYVTGAKASVSVQIACQVLMDEGIEVTVISDCVQDDDVTRLQTIIDHILPIFGNVLSLREFMENVGGVDSFSEESKRILIDLQSSNDGSACFLASDCGRRGHGRRYIQLLQERGIWRTYPTQIWYEDFVKGEFYCPLAKKVVDFCDEPEFSRIAMFLKGREFLDEKDKVIEFAGHYMPKTFCFGNGLWVDDESPPTDDSPGAVAAPWFVKEADKNLGGAAIAIVSKPSGIIQHISNNRRYVIQQHIKDPLLTDDGRKTHLKLYVLLICEDDGVTWQLYTYKGALLSISPNPWSPTDLSHATQVTIHRWPEPPEQTEGWKQHWSTTYEKCKQGTAEVIQNAINSGKLKGRPNKKQFEVFSVDWMPDSNGNIFMFEFNMSPAVAVGQEGYDPTGRDPRREYLMKHDEFMLREALAIAIPWGEGDEEAPGQWDYTGSYTA